MDGSAASTSRNGRAHKVELGLLCAGLYALVGSLALRVRGGSTPLRVDRTVSRLVASAQLRDLAARSHLRAVSPHGLGRIVVSFGFPVAGVAVALGLAWLAWVRRDFRAAALCLLGPPLAVVVTELVLKPLVDRRQGQYLAYPSGHATGAAAVAALVLVLFHRWRGWRATARLAPPALALPALLGLGLVRLGFHYPTDVIGGTAMGVATVVAVAVTLDLQKTTGPSDPALSQPATRGLPSSPRSRHRTKAPAGPG